MRNGTADRAQTRGCLPCPVGARFNCSGASVGASRGFWAHMPAAVDENTTFAFLQCPRHYCCESDDGCDAVDFCSGNRTGVLCGACRDGFTHALSASGACVESAVCSPARVGIGLALLGVVCLAFVGNTARRKRSKPNGLLKTMTSFFNSATVVLGQFGAPTGESSVAAQLAATVSAVGSGSVLPHWSVLTFCPAASTTSFEALLAPLLVPALMLASLALVALTIFALERRRGRPSGQRRVKPA